MIKTHLTRRTLLGAILAFLLPRKPAGAGDRDRGIGGTGVVDQPSGDRGLGGTGVIGTIRDFGSIIVNDMRISYSSYALLEIDGEPAPLVDLRIGQVANVVVAAKTESSTTPVLETERITVVNEVVGPIASVGKGAFTVLGQTVSTRFIGGKGFRKGQWVAVSGLRQLDGTIVASLAEIREKRPGIARVPRVVGPVTLAPGGGAQIGGLKIANLDPALAGRRVLAELGLGKGQAAAVKTIVDPELSAMPGVRQVSIEAYVANSGTEARFGSGLTAATTSPAESAQGAASRAVVIVAIKPDGKLTAASQRPAPPPAPRSRIAGRPVRRRWPSPGATRPVRAEATGGIGMTRMRPSSGAISTSRPIMLPIRRRIQDLNLREGANGRPRRRCSDQAKLSRFQTSKGSMTGRGVGVRTKAIFRT